MGEVRPPHDRVGADLVEELLGGMAENGVIFLRRRKKAAG
jgi:hypothetical protein